MLKTKRQMVAEAAGLQSCPKTLEKVIQLLPDGAWERLNSLQLGQLLRTLHDQYNAGHTAGWHEAQER
jgi:hypothetical protein